MTIDTQTWQELVKHGEGVVSALEKEPFDNKEFYGHVTDMYVGLGKVFRFLEMDAKTLEGEKGARAKKRLEKAEEVEKILTEAYHETRRNGPKEHVRMNLLVMNEMLRELHGGGPVAPAKRKEKD